MALRDRAVQATFEDWCPVCEDAIEEGEFIVKDEESGKWIHLECAEEPEPEGE